MGEHFSFAIAQPYDLSELIDCVQETFPEKEPMAVALGLSKADYLPYTDLVCQKAVAEGFTLVARSNESTALVGFCINEDFATAPTYSEGEINPKMQPLLALLEELDRGYLDARSSLFHLYMLGVRSEFAGFGLEQLVRRSLELGKVKGFTSALVEATGPISQKLCRKLSFQEKAAVDYGSFRYAGVPVFQQVRDVSHCRLLHLDL